jgi:hypothetical protein
MRNRDLPRLLQNCDLPRLLRREGRVWVVALTIGVVLFLILGV